mmetsp:Transcript_22722/g.62743  ORF Transcript_22722/g.62743 Transcript_22722/m.62743 type:complete len:88 (-) Transcript_22722:824-1087(-)
MWIKRSTEAPILLLGSQVVAALRCNPRHAPQARGGSAGCRTMMQLIHPFTIIHSAIQGMHHKPGGSAGCHATKKRKYYASLRGRACF